MLVDTQRPGVVSVAPRTSMPKMLDGPGQFGLAGLAMNCRWCFALDSEWMFIGVHYVWYICYFFILKSERVKRVNIYNYMIYYIYILHMMIKLINYTTLQSG